MREHLQHLVDEYVARGMTPAAAVDAARREFGPVAQIADRRSPTRRSRSARNSSDVGVRL